MFLKFRLLCSPNIFETMRREAKKRKSWGLHRLHPHLCLTLCCGSFEIWTSNLVHMTSTCCSLSFSFIGRTSVLEFLQLFSTHGRSEPKILFVQCWTFRFFDDENWQDVFLCFHPDIKKIWQEPKPTCDETTRSRKVHVHKWNITPWFTLQLAVKFNYRHFQCALRG